jgi:hypothetical protein
MTTIDEHLDEAYERLHTTGPELVDGLTNHAPMVVECLTHLGRGDAVHRWLDGYRGELDDLPHGRGIDDWPEALGSSRRLGDWLAYFAQRDDEPWQELLATWWPRLAPGMAAAATHGVIRTGHAVRALRSGETAPRRAELGQALAYWAALWSPLPAVAPAGIQRPREALDGVPVPGLAGRAYERLAQLPHVPGWSQSVAALAPVREPAAVLDDLLDAAVSRYATRAEGEPVMLVHSVTAPAAVALTLPSLPPELHTRSVELAWTASAALVAAYAAPEDGPARTPARSAEDAVAQAVEHGDAHVLKLTEAALRAGDRQAGLRAAAAAVQLLD